MRQRIKSSNAIFFFGSSLIPRWLPAFTLAEGPDGAVKEKVRLVDMTGDGKVDYLYVDSDGKITMRENLGTGGNDYFWLDHTGKGWGYLNTEKGENQWNALGQIAKGDYKRENVRMAVLTPSKRVDYVVLNETTGGAEWYENLKSEGGWGWKHRREIAEGPKNTIESKFGWQFKVKNVRFADLDGDGLNDYLYVNDTGATVMWRLKNTGPPEYGPATLVADGVDVLAWQVQFADTNSDGRLDYVAVGSTTGNARS
ncbi:FG-GAP repeat domain-containing protein [Aspergillus undulatus]|uniref:FG-GAP repeat domain-containing protein n=1 Tax=Aspergillus undulatus TaxID=1810928 RepID=UPI003CCD5A80